MTSLAPIKAERLRLRSLRGSDLEAVFDVLSCPLTTAGRSFAKNTKKEAERWLCNRMDEERRQGFGWWAVETNDGRLIGQCGFFDRGEEIELGYVIKAEFQKQGFGTEAVNAALTAAKTAGLRVFATIRSSNHSSAKLALRCGLKRVPERRESPPDLDLYRLF